MSKDVNIDNYMRYMRFYNKEDDKEKESPICREERQYALYLSNVLRYYGKNPGYDEKHKDVPANRIENNEKVKNIFKACGFNEKNDFSNLDNLIIDNVYYEATFMRDYFERNREIHFKKDDVKIKGNKDNSFNWRLLEYCWCNFLKESKDKLEGLIDKEIEKANFEENNYGARNEIPFLKYAEHVKKSFKNEDAFINECKKIENVEEYIRDIKLRKIVRAMMNAKPDLAVIYHHKNEKGVRKLLFIECKYESDEDNYKFFNYNENKEVIKGKISQTAVQGYIADFLCQDNGYMNGVKVSELMDNKKPKGYEGEYLSKMVKFVTAPANVENGEINIKDLIEIEKDIFDKKK